MNDGPSFARQYAAGALECAKACNRIGSVDFFEMKIGEARHQSRNVSAGGLHFDRHGNRVLVVFDKKNNRQAFIGGRVQRFPELAFA